MQTELGRRRSLTYLIAAPILTVACKTEIDCGATGTGTASATAALDVVDIADLGDALILAGALKAWNVSIEVTTDDRVVMHLPRA